MLKREANALLARGGGGVEGSGGPGGQRGLGGSGRVPPQAVALGSRRARSRQRAGLPPPTGAGGG